MGPIDVPVDSRRVAMLYSVFVETAGMDKGLS